MVSGLSNPQQRSEHVVPSERLFQDRGRFCERARKAGRSRSYDDLDSEVVQMVNEIECCLTPKVDVYDRNTGIAVACQSLRLGCGRGNARDHYLCVFKE